MLKYINYIYVQQYNYVLVASRFEAKKYFLQGLEIAHSETT